SRDLTLILRKIGQIAKSPGRVHEGGMRQPPARRPGVVRRRATCVAFQQPGATPPAPHVTFVHVTLPLLSALIWPASCGLSPQIVMLRSGALFRPRAAPERFRDWSCPTLNRVKSQSAYVSRS